MPHIQLQLSGDASARSAQAVARISALTAELLGKDPALISVAVQHIAASDWFVAGQSLQALQQSAFYLSISVTDETNTKAEKAAYLQAIYTAMAALCERLHAVSYVHIIDARAAAYGYGGRSQEFRYQLAVQARENASPDS
ncbi:4-oxalocrotonate tautomerase family protein [Comamonas sp. GB3 AK4-5]|uniref:tautomerase family protein n=1 Tax=Comamonas sp. GB3 AK4-5 TaxID=3231487 RepID=UPI00351F6B1D